MNLKQFLEEASVNFKTFLLANRLMPEKTVKIVNKFPSFFRNFFLLKLGIQAITFGNIIFYFGLEITEHTMVHELVHVRQYKEGFIKFLYEYLKEYFEKGYSKISFEIEAYGIEGLFARESNHIDRINSEREHKA